MAKRKSSSKLSFQLLYDPYSTGTDDNTVQIFHCYMNDKNAVIEINEKTYYRALQIFILNTNKKMLIAFLDNKLNLKINDSVIDDNNNIFIVKSFAMIRFTCDIPEWYTKASFVELSGEYESIGHYFTKI